MAPEKTNKPLKVFRSRGISVSVFANETTTNDRTVSYRKVSLQRAYRDADGTWKSTTSFGRDDLPIAAVLLNKAWEYILDNESSRQSSDDLAE